MAELYSRDVMTSSCELVEAVFICRSFGVLCVVNSQLQFNSGWWRHLCACDSSACMCACIHVVLL